MCGVGWLQPLHRRLSLRESMRERDVEILLQRAYEKFPEAKPRIITDKRPAVHRQRFQRVIRVSGRVPLSLDDAKRLIAQYVQV